ncbi:unnamed protein product [Oppiella nova]|uniref:Protein kinase domain-containing protein n=1 Tax=Oppiella nova TaxID=334625 RepID=A0A7R9MEM9_9ACAR|nr:unnamed protein product [Oppiella nova]CAG2175925.1 unnamed protein product [Oppiella nova]
MDLYEYFISCEMFRQILEAVNYLHEMNPKIIHKDLKPDNILIAQNVRDGRFLKLCDFGLSTVHDKRVHYRTTRQHMADIGNIRYIAPEVFQGKKYNHKCDVYALALIGGNIFDLDVFDLNISQTYSTAHTTLTAPVLELQTLLASMFTSTWAKRPECREVIDKHHEWSIDKNILTNDTEFDGTLQRLEANDNSFFYLFLISILYA